MEEQGRIAVITSGEEGASYRPRTEILSGKRALSLNRKTKPDQVIRYYRRLRSYGVLIIPSELPTPIFSTLSSAVNMEGLTRLGQEAVCIF